MAADAQAGTGEVSISRWWRVVGGMSMNLALGSLYAWSVFVAPLEKEFGWKRADTSSVFGWAVIVFAISFIIAGRLQDKFGPFWVSVTGGLLVSLGFFLCSFTSSLTYLIVCFGLLGGIGNGFGYATPIPVMAKFRSWPSGSRTGEVWRSVSRWRATVEGRPFSVPWPTLN